MTVVATDLRETRPQARELKNIPLAPVTANDVQGAINQLGAAIVVAGTSPPSLTPKTITAAMSPYTILATDYFLLCDTTTGAITLQTQASATRSNKECIVKDIGNAAVNAIAILRTGAELVDGLTSYPIDTNYDEVVLRPITGGYAVTK